MNLKLPHNLFPLPAPDDDAEIVFPAEIEESIDPAVRRAAIGLVYALTRRRKLGSPFGTAVYHGREGRVTVDVSGVIFDSAETTGRMGVHDSKAFPWRREREPVVIEAQGRPNTNDLRFLARALYEVCRENA